MFESPLYKVEMPESKGNWKNVVFKGIDTKFANMTQAIKFDGVRRT